MENKGISEQSSDETSNSPLRSQYLAEIEKIQQEFGSLEEMRLSLGLSQRKTCQLLLVDPSAWTRWNKTGAPPHIYQSLKWILLLKKMNPDAIVPNEVSQRVDLLHSKTQSKIEGLEKTVQFLERSLYFLKEKLDAKAPLPIPQNESATIVQKTMKKSAKKSKKVKSNLTKKKTKQKTKPKVRLKFSKKLLASKSARKMAVKKKIQLKRKKARPQIKAKARRKR